MGCCSSKTKSSDANVGAEETPQEIEQQIAVQVNINAASDYNRHFTDDDSDPEELNDDYELDASGGGDDPAPDAPEPQVPSDPQQPEGPPSNPNSEMPIETKRCDRDRLVDFFGEPNSPKQLTLTKYGNHSTPHTKVFSADIETGKVSHGKKSVFILSAKRIHCGKLTELLKGKGAVLERCFSMEMRTRTLDFECDSPEQRDLIVEHLRKLKRFMQKKSVRMDEDPEEPAPAPTRVETPVEPVVVDDIQPVVEPKTPPVEKPFVEESQSASSDEPASESEESKVPLDDKPDEPIEPKHPEPVEPIEPEPLPIGPGSVEPKEPAKEPAVAPVGILLTSLQSALLMGSLLVEPSSEVLQKGRFNIAMGRGLVVRKFGRDGSIHHKVLSVRASRRADGVQVEWSDLPKHDYSNPQLKKQTLAVEDGFYSINKSAKHIAAQGVFSVVSGCKTDLFKKKLESQPNCAKVSRCFSVVVPKRSLDCECDWEHARNAQLVDNKYSPELRDVIVRGLRFLVGLCSKHRQKSGLSPEEFFKAVYKVQSVTLKTLERDQVFDKKPEKFQLLPYFYAVVRKLSSKLTQSDDQDTPTESKEGGQNSNIFVKYRTSSIPWNDFISQFTRLSAVGDTFIKHGEKGNPKKRNVHLKISQVGSGGYGVLHFGKKQVKIDSSTKVKIGMSTPYFQRDTSYLRKADPQCCFSVLAKERTVDLQCDSKNQRNAWVFGLRLVIEQWE